jgi:hypothetical protein
LLRGGGALGAKSAVGNTNFQKQANPLNFLYVLFSSCWVATAVAQTWRAELLKHTRKIQR